jgi:anti-anti-sigma factor
VDADFTILLLPPCSRLVVSGELDLRNRHQLILRLGEASRLCSTTLELDVVGVEFIDCCCLAVIDTSRRDLESDGRRLEVVAASPWFRRVSALAGYEQLARTAPRPGV